MAIGNRHTTKIDRILYSHGPGKTLARKERKILEQERKERERDKWIAGPLFSALSCSLSVFCQGNDFEQAVRLHASYRRLGRSAGRASSWGCSSFELITQNDELMNFWCHFRQICSRKSQTGICRISSEYLQNFCRISKMKFDISANLDELKLKLWTILTIFTNWWWLKLVLVQT